MILLRANQELRQTFEKLILTMDVPVKWSGIFAVADDYMILLGEVRSLFFHFESRKVVTNIIDITVKETEVWEIMGNIRVRNVINMILYAFGKWGTIGGLRVEKNYSQLNKLFASILKEIGIDSEYTQSHFYFYKDGMRVTYEDVIQIALEEPEDAVAEESEPETERGGLWHKIIWKRTEVSFPHVETTLSQRQKERIGNNFYMIGYLCPACGQPLHMVVYPADNEFRIETEEGGVLLARACACDHCNCFYTPRPGKLLSEGDVYFLSFEEDRKAYEDYLELLGRQGMRISNSNYNEYVDKKRESQKSGERSLDVPGELPEEALGTVEELSGEALDRVEARMDEMFYSDAGTKKFEKKVREQKKKRKREKQLQEKREKRQKAGKRENPEKIKKTQKRENPEAARNGGGEEQTGRGKIRTGAEHPKTGEKYESDRQSSEHLRLQKEDFDGNVGGSEKKAGEETASVSSRDGEAKRQLLEKYEAKLKMFDRFSDRQKKELRKQIEADRELLQEEKEDFLERMERRQKQARVHELEQKVDDCAGKSYASLRRVAEEISGEELPTEEKSKLLDGLERRMKQQAEREVAKLMETMPPAMDRAQYRSFVEKLHSYDGVDLSAYEPKLAASVEKAERTEIASLVRHARKNTRGDLVKLADALARGGFHPEFVNPYIEKIKEKLRAHDQAAIEEIVKDVQQMSFEEGKEAYDRIAEGEFLPELKSDALRMLEKRLSKIKTDESELLVAKLKTECGEAGIAENSRHHYYPARKVLMGQAEQGETEVIDYALASYASGCGLFEYPILVVDTSRNRSGKEGMILTPEHLYYSTLFSSFGMDIGSIERVAAQTGLLNRGIYVYQKNGTKTKLPSAVDTKELSSFAGVLNEFIHYLQEKPDSRSLTYLAKEKHETICCFRCGAVYRGGTVCPKCGFKNNG